MLTKKEVAEIRQRFEAGGADGPLRIEGDHLKDDGDVIGLGWHVCGTSKMGDHEYTVSYASHTTFEAATFLVHLPIDIPALLSSVEQAHLLIAGLLSDDEEAKRIARHIVIDRVREERETTEEPSE